MDIDTGVTTRLGYGGCPALSRDGTRVVYASYDSQPQTTVLVDLGTGQRWHVEQESVGGFHCSGRAGSISSDNSKVALDGVYVWEDENQRHLARGTNPAWSPGGGWIAFYEAGRLRKMPASGGNSVELAESTWTSPPSWSVKDEIAFVRNEDIYVIKGDGSEQRRLTDHPGIDRYPNWSPDGEKILFGSDRLGRLKWFIIDADGGDAVHIPMLDGYDSVSWTQ
jgi:Tol biopolymer transport system component